MSRPAVTHTSPSGGSRRRRYDIPTFTSQYLLHYVLLDLPRNVQTKYQIRSNQTTMAVTRSALSGAPLESSCHLQVFTASLCMSWLSYSVPKRLRQHAQAFTHLCNMLQNAKTNCANSFSKQRSDTVKERTRTGFPGPTRPRP